METIAREDASRLRFLDETSVRIDFARRYGRAPDGARLLYLPPYSPGFSPIELAFSKLKTALRTAAVRTRQALQQALIEAINWISDQDAKNWFDHCGYHVQ